MTAALIGAPAVAVALAPAAALDELGRVDVGLPASYFRQADAAFLLWAA